MEMTATDEPSGRLPRHDAKHLQPQRGGIIVDFSCPTASTPARVPSSRALAEPGDRDATGWLLVVMSTQRARQQGQRMAVGEGLPILGPI